jgi:hypothetical protein
MARNILLAVFAVLAVSVGAVLATEQSGEPPSTKPPSSPPAVEQSAAGDEDDPPATFLPATTTAGGRAADTLAATEAVPASAPEIDLPAPLAAPPVDPSDFAPGWQQRRGQAALAKIPYPWSELGFTIRFLPERAGYKAGTFPLERVVEVYVRPGATVDELAHDIAHELGHVIDWSYLTTRDRLAWKAARGYPTNPSWHTCNACTDYETPAGDFAETFAYWVLGGQVEFRSELAAPPPEDVLEDLGERFFRKV